MPEEQEEQIEESPEEKKPETVKVKKKGGWSKKIPRDVLLSPGGAVLIFLALIIELIDWIPLPILDQIIELPLEILFIVFLITITKVPFLSLVVPFVIERIPFVSDILPTWLIRLFI